MGFFAKANQLKGLLASGKFQPNSVFKSTQQVEQVIFNNQLDGVLMAGFMVVVLAMLAFTVQACLKALQSDRPTAHEIPYAPLPANADDIIKGAAH